MMKLIEPNQAKECASTLFNDPILKMAVNAVVDNCPVTEIVQCKDCVSYDERCPGFGYCYHWDYEPGMSPNQVDADDFCSYGERKDK